jgi:hypothetical protein
VVPPPFPARVTSAATALRSVLVFLLCLLFLTVGFC